MNGPVAEVRAAVRKFLDEVRPDRVTVAVSGGADSLALAACVGRLVPGASAVIVDHQLQPGSDEVASRAARPCAAFTEYVVERVGMDGFNTIWTSADTLPTRAEIAEPMTWLRRVSP